MRKYADGILAGVFFLLCIGCPLIAGEQQSTVPPRVPGPRQCASYADCPKGMMCAGAGGGAMGSCVWPGELPQARPAHDPLPAGYLGSIYGHPIIQGQAPAGAPASDAGGVWDMKEGAYRPPRGGKWIYRRAGPDGFAGSWTYLP